MSIPKIYASLRYEEATLEQIIRSILKEIKIYYVHKPGSKEWYPRIALLNSGKFIKMIDLDSEEAFNKLWTHLENF